MKQNAKAEIQLKGGLSLNILTDDVVKKIHQGTLEVLDQTGVFVEDETALDCFESGGARVDRKHKMVQIPPHLVKEAIRSAPSKVILAGRDPKHDLVLEGDRVHFTNFSEGVRSQSRPELIDRQTRDVWEKAGATIAYERAVAKAKWILENHQPEPLSNDVLNRIRAINGGYGRRDGDKP